MRHRKKGKKLDRTKAPRQALMRNLATSLILYEKIRTTKAKAKAVKPLVERLITVGKKGDVRARRILSETLYVENAVKKAVEELGPRYKDRRGGYLRIVNLGHRAGDAAEMVQVEFV